MFLEAGVKQHDRARNSWQALAHAEAMHGYVDGNGGAKGSLLDHAECSQEDGM